MTNTTEDYWSADGVSLQTYAQNIVTLGGRFSPPKFRGDDITIPYSSGQRFIPKIPDSRIIPLAMWIRGYMPDDSLPSDGDLARQFDENWRTLRNLLWQPKRQFSLQKRFRNAGLLRSATALAQYNDGLEPTMMGRNGAKFEVDLKLTDPYFYDDELKSFPLVNGDNTIEVPGDEETLTVVITINGSRTNPILVNETLGLQVEYHDSIGTGASVEIDVKNYSAITTPNGSPAYDSTGKLRHTGANYLFALAAGSNVINLSSSSGLGTVTLQARGAWI